VGKEYLPSFGTIEGRIKIAEAKIGHLYVFLDRMTQKLTDLLAQQNSQPLADNPRVEAAISALLNGGKTGKRHGFRGSYTIPDGVKQCVEARALIRKYTVRLDTLRARDPSAGKVELGAKLTESGTNVAMSALNYPAIFDATHAVDVTPGMSPSDIQAAKSAVTPAEIFGVAAGQELAKTVAASFGLFNDASAALNEAKAYLGGGEEAEGGKDVERDVRTSFNTAPSGIVSAGSTAR
jgi:hypothetical protein